MIVSDFTFPGGPKCGHAELTIRASKSDPEAVGCKRVLACMCPLVICPVAAAEALAQGKRLDEHVLRDNRGEVMSKQDTVRLLRAFAARAKCDTERIAGHSMRTTGAQRMAAAGLSTTQINASGRWGSLSQMIKYAREAHIGPSIIADAMRKLVVGTGKAGTRPTVVTKRWSTFRSNRTASG